MHSINLLLVGNPDPNYDGTGDVNINVNVMGSSGLGAYQVRVLGFVSVVITSSAHFRYVDN